MLYTAVEVLTKLWAPILCHTCEEINDFMHFDEESIHLTSFQSLELNFDTEALREKMDTLFKVRKDVLKAMEESRAQGVIGKSLEAKVCVHVDDQTKAIMEEIVKKPQQWLIVSQFAFTADQLPMYEFCSVKVEHADGHACPRCWNYTTSENEDGLCDRCAHILHK